MLSHRVMYLRDKNGAPVGCAAIKLRDGLIEYQYSVVNPLDKFDKAVARWLALGKLQEAPYTTLVPFAAGKDHTMYDTSFAVMTDIARDSHAPTRARKAAKLWLKRNMKKADVMNSNYAYFEIPRYEDLRPIYDRNV